jgi:hypothetical protein
MQYLRHWITLCLTLKILYTDFVVGSFVSGWVYGTSCLEYAIYYFVMLFIFFLLAVVVNCKCGHPPYFRNYNLTPWGFASPGHVPAICFPWMPSPSQFASPFCERKIRSTLRGERLWAGPPHLRVFRLKMIERGSTVIFFAAWLKMIERGSTESAQMDWRDHFGFLINSSEEIL